MRLLKARLLNMSASGAIQAKWAFSSTTTTVNLQMNNLKSNLPLLKAQEPQEHQDNSAIVVCQQSNQETLPDQPILEVVEQSLLSWVINSWETRKRPHLQRQLRTTTTLRASSPSRQPIRSITNWWNSKILLQSRKTSKRRLLSHSGAMHISRVASTLIHLPVVFEEI